MSDAIEETAASVAASPEVATPVAAPADEVAAKLKEFGATDEVVTAVKELGVETVADLSQLTEADLTEAGLKLVKARKLVDDVKPAKTSTPDAAANILALDGLLPQVQDDESWLKALKTGGVLKIDKSTAMAAVRATLAKRVGLFDVPAKLVAAMEEFAEESEEQVDPTFFALRKQMTRRNYADIFAAVEGLDGAYVTDKRKEKLLTRLDSVLWPAIVSFDGQIKAWYEGYRQQLMGPDLLTSIAESFRGGGVASEVLMDTAVLHDAADTVKDAINRVFAGTGVQIAAALAYEATEVKKSLEDPRLPSFVGAANREQMLKKLDVAVPPSYPRLETNLTKYVLAVMGLEDQASGTEEIQYVKALWALGSQIDWTQLGSGDRRDRISRLGGEAARRVNDL